MLRTYTAVLVMATVFTLLAFQNCQKKFRSKQDPIPQSQGYVKLHWDTAGGGDLHFDVTPTVGENNFLVSNISSYGTPYSDVEMEISLDLLPQLATGLGNIFAGGYSIPIITNGGLGGTWTTIKLYDSEGHISTTNNVDTHADPVLEGLYRYVKDNVSSP